MPICRSRTLTHLAILHRIHGENLVHPCVACCRPSHGSVAGIVGLYSVIAYSVVQRKGRSGFAWLSAQRDGIDPNVRPPWIAARRNRGWLRCGRRCSDSPDVVTVIPCELARSHNVLRGDLGLVATAMLASYVPSRRAATVDPVEALRAE